VRTGVRLADVRLPRAWPLAVLGAHLMARREQDRSVDEAAAIGREIAESVVTRWQQNDAGTQAMIDLTRTLARLTWVLVFVGLATLAVAIITVAQG
jgi:hypothetical protein